MKHVSGTNDDDHSAGLAGKALGRMKNQEGNGLSTYFKPVVEQVRLPAGSNTLKAAHPSAHEAS
jgi:hypothetical protein